MRRFFLTLLCIAAISAAVFYVVSVPRVLRDIRAVDGVVDLRGADFTGGLYALAGEWEFYGDRLRTPEELRAEREKTGVKGSENNSALPVFGSALAHVPGSWYGSGFYRIGHGTYRLTVLLPEDKDLMLYVPEIRSASAVWVNGRKIHSAGRVGTDRDEEIPRPKNGIYDLRADNGGGPLREAEIVVQVSSYDRFFGGIRNNFHIGADSVLLHWAVGRWASAASLAGAFLVIGLYHFMLWLFQRPRYTAYLVFAAHCAVGGVRFLIEKDSVVQYLASESLAAFINPVSTFLLTLHSLTGAALVLFVFEIRQGRAMLAFYSISFAALLAAQLFLPMPLRYVLGIFCLVPMTAFLVQAARALSARRFREHPWLWLYFVSFALYCVWAPFGNTRMDRYFFLPHIAPNIFITLVQLVTLSLDYAETKRRERELATKTDFYHRMSHDLLTPLTVVSTNIQVANMKSETDHERLADSQTEIMKMAAMISEALVEGRGEEGADR